MQKISDLFGFYWFLFISLHCQSKEPVTTGERVNFALCTVVRTEMITTPLDVAHLNKGQFLKQTKMQKTKRKRMHGTRLCCDDYDAVMHQLGAAVSFVAEAAKEIARNNPAEGGIYRVWGLLDKAKKYCFTTSKY